MRYCMPQEGYGSVSAPEDKIEQASEYKPAGATWGEVLVAGAERLNGNLDSDMADADGVPIHVPERNHDRAEAVKDEFGDTWGGVLMYYVTHRGHLTERNANADLPDAVRDQLDRIEEAAKEATNAAQSAERTAEELQR